MFGILDWICGVCGHGWFSCGKVNRRAAAGGLAQSAAKLLVHQSAITAQKWKPDSDHNRITGRNAHTHRHGVQAEVFASTDRELRRRFAQLQNAAVAQLDRALVSEAEGCGFDPRRLHSLEIFEIPYLSASLGTEARFLSSRVNSHSNPLMLKKAARRTAKTLHRPCHRTESWEDAFDERA